MVAVTVEVTVGKVETTALSNQQETMAVTDIGVNCRKRGPECITSKEAGSRRDL